MNYSLPGFSVGFPTESGLPFASLEDLPDPGIKLKSPALQADSLPLRHEGFPWIACSSSELIWRYMAVTRRQLDFPGGSDGKASVYNVGDLGPILGLGRSAGEGNGNPLHTLAWKFPWTEEPGRLQSMGSQRVEHDWATSLSFHFLEGGCNVKDLIRGTEIREFVKGLTWWSSG